MKTEFEQNDKNRQTHLSRVFILIIFMSSVYNPIQAIGATNANSSRSGFGWQYEYDSRGRISSMTNPANKRTSIHYTQNNRGGLSSMTQQHPNGSKVKLSFDKYGRRTEMVDNEGSVTYTYDKLGRLSKVHRNGAEPIVYGYDTLGRIKSISIGSQFALGYKYDFRGRPEKITTPVGSILYSYIGDTGEVVRRLPNGITTRWTHGADGRMDSIAHSLSGNRPLARYQYSYRLDGLITSIKQRGASGEETLRYNYDSAQRLTSVSGSNRPKIEYAYDKFGNRTSLNRQGSDPVLAEYDWAGRLTRYDGRTCQHDPAGNLILATGSTKSFIFDDIGLLKTVALGTGDINYTFDGDGNMISRSVGSATDSFLPDPVSDIWQPLMIKRANGQQTYYIWDGGSPLMAITSGQVRYFLHDHLGSVRLVADRRGDILERRDYTPFGQMEQKPAGVSLQPGYAGLFFDKAASVYLTQARAYDPELARFFQPDPEHRVPMGSQKDLSVYAYCGGDPVNYVDLTGAAPIPLGDRVLNWIGTGSVWIGRNRSGGIMSHKQDSLGQFPLGDTRLCGKTATDNYARLHDTEYWVSTHFPKGTQVKVPAPGGKYEYFVSEGNSRLTRINLRVMGKSLAAPHRFTPLSSSFSRGRSTPWPNIPVTRELKYDAREQSMIAFQHKDTRSIGGAYWQSRSHKIAVRGAIEGQVLDVAKDAGFKYLENLSLLNRPTTQKYLNLAGKHGSKALTVLDAGMSGYAAGKSINEGNYATAVVQASKPLASYGLGLAVSAAPLHITAAGAVVAAPAFATVVAGVGVAYATERTYTMAKLSAGIIDTHFKIADQNRQTDRNINRHVSTMRSQGRSNQEIWNSLDRFGVAQDHRSKYVTGGAGVGGAHGLNSVRVTHTRTHYQESFNGADFNRAYANYEKTGIYRGPMENHNSGFNQSPVGGVRLSGAGNALSHLGGLEGIALDETNGRLVLVGQGRSPINLPPLRLDDVVTIFRCVYLHGSAPSVTIDPISDKDTEKWMKVIHGKGTENTYVGWILYEADRIMKNYGLGKDNKTKKKIYSRIPGYRDFNAIGTYSRKKRWERFWIVPASQTRTQGTTSELTMFDIPLKLKTEKMEWDGTKLVTAKNPTPSKSATAYTKWFTMQYDKIAKEVKLTPPKHFGIDKPVAIFEELNRIALISGIAETLRDQNVPFPAWMYDYPVKTCISDSQTPRIKVTGKGYQVHGGVQLSPTAKSIKTVTGDVHVAQLAKTVQTKIATKPLFAPVTFQQKGKTYTAVTLPGSDTYQSGANILRHNDLSSDVLYDAGIQLARHFNSFYDPCGIFGRGWTLDLPQLKSYQQPVNRTEKTVSYKKVYQLTSPLNSWSERFADVGNVPELNRQLMVPSRQGEILGLADANLRIIGRQTKELIFRDGGSWHFDADGYLTAQSDENTIVLYLRNDNHTISSVKSYPLKGGGLTANSPQAELYLTYKNETNRVASIEARSPKLDKSLKATYIYDKGDQLMMAFGTDVISKYTYRNGLVTSITKDDEKLASFQYNEQGQLQQESHGDEKKVAYQRINTSYGSKVVAMDADNKEVIETVEYDANLLPLARSSTLEDGSKLAWRQKDKVLETTVADADGEGYTLTESNDGRQNTLKTTAGMIQTTDFDNEGRLTRYHVEDGPTLEQSWYSDGRLQSAISDDQRMIPRYTGDGKLSSILIKPSDQNKTGQDKQYVKTSYDVQGRVTNVTDDSGGQLRIDYDISGQPSEFTFQQGSVTIDRNSKGQVTEVGTTWGLAEKYEYDNRTGDLSRVTLLQQNTGTANEEASIELTDGRIAKIRQPDGGETVFDYYQDERQKGMLKNLLTSEELALDYYYDSTTRLTGINIGGANNPVYRVSYNYDQKGRLAGISYSPDPR